MVHSNQMPIATNSDKIILNSEKDTKEFAENLLSKIKPNYKVFISVSYTHLTLPTKASV